MLPSAVHSTPQYPAASYQPASHSQCGDPSSLFPTTLAIRVAVQGHNGHLTIQTMPIAPRIRIEELIRQVLQLYGLENDIHAMSYRLQNFLLMRRVGISNVMLSVVGAAHPHDMPFSLS
jgi:hypothetical protein